MLLSQNSNFTTKQVVLLKLLHVTIPENLVNQGKNGDFNIFLTI